MKKTGTTRLSNVSIGGLPFKIKYYVTLPKRLRKELGADTVGYCDWFNQEIGIVIQNKNKTLDKLTLFHEIGHAVADSIKTNNGLANEAFARPFFQFFFGALIDAGLIKL